MEPASFRAGMMTDSRRKGGGGDAVEGDAAEGDAAGVGVARGDAVRRLPGDARNLMPPRASHPHIQHSSAKERLNRYSGVTSSSFLVIRRGSTRIIEGFFGSPSTETR